MICDKRLVSVRLLATAVARLEVLIILIKKLVTRIVILVAQLNVSELINHHQQAKCHISRQG
jgi:hypothetical protein